MKFKGSGVALAKLIDMVSDVLQNSRKSEINVL